MTLFELKNYLNSLDENDLSDDFVVEINILDETQKLQSKTVVLESNEGYQFDLCAEKVSISLYTPQIPHKSDLLC